MGSLTIEKPKTSEEKLEAKTPYAQIFKETLKYAYKNKASDIHLEPTKSGLSIRIRLNGDLSTYKTLASNHKQSFIQEVKRLTNLSIAISSKPQDTRLSLPNWNLALRVNSVPSLYGEKIVLRLLDMTTNFDFSNINLDPDSKSELINATNSENGVILISGATGSGKSRTLFSLLNSIDKEKRSIVTLEDPVEYTFDGMNQIEIKKGVSFADGLRAVLRQDPDVILIGEIRDNETADLCFKAAATGHVVLSTLHANSSAKVIERLEQMGVKRYVIESNLVLSSAQRLLKELCPSCKKNVTNLRKCHVNLDTKRVRTVNENGCRDCNEGIIGRIPIMEYLTRKELNENKHKPKETLFDKCLALANKGVIDYREIFKYEVF